MQCKKWTGRSRLEDGRSRCVLESGHDCPCDFRLLPTHPSKPDKRCREHKSKHIVGLELVWRCIEDKEHDGQHVFRVAPDEEIPK